MVIDPRGFLNYSYMSYRCRGCDSAGLDCGLNVYIYKLPDDADSADLATSEKVGKE